MVRADNVIDVIFELRGMQRQALKPIDIWACVSVISESDIRLRYSVIAELSIAAETCIPETSIFSVQCLQDNYVAYIKKFDVYNFDIFNRAIANLRGPHDG